MTSFGVRPHPQLRCPYTLKPLADVAELRSEPILPLSLGGPAEFDVLVDRQPVAGAPSSDDRSFGDNALLLMLRMRHGPGTAAAAGRWGQDSFGLVKRNPFEGLPAHELAAVSAGIARIAYLAVFEFLGDQFLDDPLNQEWRNLIGARSTAEVARSELAFMPLGPAEVLYEAALLPDLGPHEHAITICNFQQNTPLVALKLFGCLSHVFRVSQCGTYGLELLEGQIAVCDSVKRTVRIQSFMPPFLGFASRYHLAAGDIPPFRLRSSRCIPEKTKPMDHQKSVLRAIILEILAGREHTSLEPYCQQNLFLGVAEVLERREPRAADPNSIELPRIALSDTDTLVAQEVFWDLIVERVITPGYDHANQSLPFFRIHSEATRLQVK